MREVVSSFLSYCLANGLYTAQQTAKMLGASSSLVDAKNPPGPGPEARRPSTVAGKLYFDTRRKIEKFGDPAAASFIALDEYLSKNVDFVFNVFSSPKGYRPYYSSLPKQLVDQAKLAVATLGPQSAIHMRQAQNTSYIFKLVRNNPEKLGVPKSGEFDLPTLWKRPTGSGTTRTSGRWKALAMCTPSAPGF